MPIITAINPRKKPRKTGSNGKVEPMAKKRRRRSPAKTKTIVRYRTKKNPTRARRAGRAAAGYAKSTIAGINVGGALKSTIPLLLGGLACKFAAKKFTDGGADGENWTWKNYAFGLLGGFVAAFGAQALFKTKTGTTQKILEGALLLTAYKIFVNEIAPSNSTIEQWFGSDESLPDYDGLGAYGADPNYYNQMYGAADLGPSDFAPPMGDIYQADDDDYIQGNDGAWRPLSEAHRMPMEGYGATEMISKPTAQMGFAGYGATEMLSRPNSQMGEDDSLFYSEF